MFQFKCCGIISEEDYHQSQWRKKALGMIHKFRWQFWVGIQIMCKKCGVCCSSLFQDTGRTKFGEGLRLGSPVKVLCDCQSARTNLNCNTCVVMGEVQRNPTYLEKKHIE